MKYLKPVLQIIPDESQQSSHVIASKSASIKDLRGNPSNKCNNVDCHGSQNAIEPRNDGKLDLLKKLIESDKDKLKTLDSSLISVVDEKAKLDDELAKLKANNLLIDDLEKEKIKCQELELKSEDFKAMDIKLKREKLVLYTINPVYERCVEAEKTYKETLKKIDTVSNEFTELKKSEITARESYEAAFGFKLNPILINL